MKPFLKTCSIYKCVDPWFRNCANIFLFLRRCPEFRCQFGKNLWRLCEHYISEKVKWAKSNPIRDVTCVTFHWAEKIIGDNVLLTKESSLWPYEAEVAMPLIVKELFAKWRFCQHKVLLIPFLQQTVLIALIYICHSETNTKSDKPIYSSYRLSTSNCVSPRPHWLAPSLHFN